MFEEWLESPFFWFPVVALVFAAYAIRGRDGPRRRLRGLVLEHLAIATARGLPIGQGLLALSRDRAESVSALRPARSRAALGEAELIRRIAERHEATASLSQALAREPEHFPPEVTDAIAAAENAGALPAVLEHLVEAEEAARLGRSKLVDALTYPFVLFCLVSGVSLFLSLVIVPKFRSIALSMEIDPPPLEVGYAATALTVGGVAVVSLFAALVSSSSGLGRWLREKLGPVVAVVPVVGGPVRALGHGRWLGRVAAFAAAGRPLPEALETAARLESGPAAGRLAKAAGLAREGRPLAEVLTAALDRDRWLVPRVLLAVSLEGPGSGFAATSRTIEERAWRRLDVLRTAAEPVPTFLCALVAGAHAYVIWSSILSIEAFVAGMVGP